MKIYFSQEIFSQCLSLKFRLKMLVNYIYIHMSRRAWPVHARHPWEGQANISQAIVSDVSFLFLITKSTTDLSLLSPVFSESPLSYLYNIIGREVTKLSKVHQRCDDFSYVWKLDKHSPADWCAVIQNMVSFMWTDGLSQDKRSFYFYKFTVMTLSEVSFIYRSCISAAFFSMRCWLI